MTEHQPTLTDVWEAHIRDLLVSVDILNRHAKAKAVRLAAQRVLESWEDTHTALLRLDVTLARITRGESGEVPGKSEIASQEAHEAGLANPPPTHVQTIIFEREIWKRPAAARRWLRDHKHHSGKVDTTPATFRFRQRAPEEFDPSSYRTIPFGETSGISAVIGHLK